MTRARSAAWWWALLTQWALVASFAGAQELTSWNTHSELLKWVNTEGGDVKPDTVEQLWDGAQPYIRMHLRRGDNSSFSLSSQTEIGKQRPAPIFDVRKYNAVELRVRGHGLGAIAATWVDTGYDGESAPYTSHPRRLSPSNAWQELQFRFSDSPFYQNKPIALLAFMPSLSYEEAATDLQALSEINDFIQAENSDAYMDVARTTLIHVEESIPNPFVRSFRPKAARDGDEITIHGSGFGALPLWNVVEVNDQRVSIDGGDDHHLRLHLRSMDHNSELRLCRKCSIVVRTRGGRKVMASQTLEWLGDPYIIRFAAPDDRRGMVSSPRGSTLAVVIRVLDPLERALAGEKVTFDVSSGSTLSTTNTVTGRDGIARTSVTLGGEPHPGAGVTIHAKSGAAEGNLVVNLQ